MGVVGVWLGVWLWLGWDYARVVVWLELGMKVLGGEQSGGRVRVQLGSVIREGIGTVGLEVLGVWVVRVLLGFSWVA